MKREWRHADIVFVLWVAVLVWPSTGCSSYLYGQRTGRVEVGHPQVFSRERLVEDRLREVQWLEGRFGSYNATTQGIIDLRTFVGMYASLKGDFNPLGGRLSDAQVRAEVADVQNTVEERNLIHRTKVLALQQRIAQLQKDLDSGNVTGGSNSAPPQPPTGATVTPAEVQKLRDDLAALKEEVANKELPTKSQGVPLLDPTQAKKSAAQISAMEAVSDEKAYRDFVAALLREKQLDDAHDMNGYTLYELKMDVTFIPNETENEYALLDLEVLPEATERTLKGRIPSTTTGQDAAFESSKGGPIKPLFRKYEKWLTALGQEIGKEALWIQQKPFTLSGVDLVDVHQVLERESRALWDKHDQLIAGESNGQSTQLTENKDLVQKEIDWLERYCISPLQKIRFSSNEEYERNTKSGVQQSEEEGGLNDRIRFALGCYSYYKYKRQLVDYVSMEKPSPISIGQKIFYIPVMRSKGVLGFLAWAQEINKRSPDPIVMAVEPKESVQNISEVASREQLLTLAMGLNAALPNGIGVDAFSKFVRQSQALLEAIQRPPQVVSFSNSSRFGWLLGPKFAISKDEPTFKYLPVKHSFTVSIKAPAWSDHICMRAQYRWIDHAGKISVPYEVQGFPLQNVSAEAHKSVWMHSRESIADKNESRQDDPCADGSIPVQLIPDPTALVASFLHSSDRSGRRPHVSLPISGSMSIVNPSPKNPSTLLIRGTDLWRNPKVFIDSTEACGVSILPDMGGILAVFNRPLVDIPQIASNPSAVTPNPSTPGAPSAAPSNTPPSSPSPSPPNVSNPNTSSPVSSKKPTLTVVTSFGADAVLDVIDVVQKRDNGELPMPSYIPVTCTSGSKDYKTSQPTN